MSSTQFGDSSNSARFRSLDEFEDHEMVIALTDKASGLHGYIGIHSTLLGPALGGTRFQSYDTEEEGLKDALRLSRAMSYKCALAGLPYGGGKGVIIAGSEQSRDAMLTAYAKAVENLRGLFKTGTDVGVTDQDVATMGQHTRHMLGLTEADRGSLTTANCAALGVFYSIKAARQFMDKTDDLTDMRVAIKGVGKLGGELARLLHEAGAKVMASDTDTKQTAKLADTLPGIEIIDNYLIHRQQVDIYAPCALGNEFSDVVIDELGCRAIIGGANNQLPRPESGTILADKSILYVPDYIANAGGLIYVADELEPGGFNKDRVLQRVAAIQDTVTDVLERTARLHMPTSAIADQIAVERMGKKAV